MLNSATGCVLPEPRQPPITVMSTRLSETSGNSVSSSAALVSEPVQTKWICMPLHRCQGMFGSKSLAGQFVDRADHLES